MRINRVLGIETSCDETSFAVVDAGNRVVRQVLASSLEFHSRYGGIIPEIAARRHLEVLSPLLMEMFERDGIDVESLDLIAVTNRPGLAPSLLVGLACAKAFSLGLDLDIVGVDHTLAHLYAPFLDNPDPPQMPFVGLVISGGHTLLFMVRDWHPKDIELVGKTKDDAVGEALDKAGRLLGLGYPGGPIIEKKALEGSPRFEFPVYRGRDYDFSFSGVKTALLYFLRDKELSEDFVCDVCASFQKAVMEPLVEKTIRLAKETGVRDVVVGGGVSANRYLRERFQEAGEGLGLRIHFPPMRYCLDNASMVAGLGYQWYIRGIKDDLSLSISSRV